ncbi:hypothetical protein [Clostridium tagluense]|uniref:Uncharacterized protein n=1 Tax=Clostridium tagluense TaxID=360422 RepID=A0A401UTR7_9CLOT|nr:hypothetical protein [Clostridium tagluense]GCD12911.1 hypothetical protein Ctaglu_45340 [Clostridium tagluense]
MFLSREERVLLLVYRIQKERELTLMGGHTSYDIGEKRIIKLKKKIEKIGGNPNLILDIK